MYRLRIKQLVVFLFPVFVSCGFADLRPIGVKTFPAEPYTVLSSEYSPVILRFDTEMLKPETEEVLQVSYYGGFVDGDLRWDGKALYFVPAAPWKAGVRYVLKLSGTVYSTDGRELLLSKVIPFFALSSSPAPYVQSFAPEDGESVEAFIPGETVLEFAFSLPMDRRSAETALALEGAGAWKAEWLDDDRLLRIQCENALSPWVVYRWSLSGEALSREGVPLAGPVSGRFITDKDKVRPAPLRIIPLLKSAGWNGGLWGNWIAAGMDLENGLGPGQGIGIEFNKPMDAESLRRSLSFTPSLPGRTEELSPVSAVFIPDRNPEPGLVYTLTISGDVRDSRGFKMGDDYILFFTADIPYLKILSLSVDEEEEIFEPERGGSSLVSLDIPGGGVLRFTLAFSPPFSPEEQVGETFRISLDPFFPGTLPPVSLRFARWLSSNMVRMEWEGLEAGTEDEPHYYQLRLPGGRNGINNGRGSYFEEDFQFYFMAVEK
jgi:hypothetical protein